MSALDEIRAERVRKLKLLEEKGINPYPNRARRTHEIREILSGFETLEKGGENVVVDGRIRAIRTHGGSSFVDIEDGTGKLQLFLKKDEIGEEAFSLFESVVDNGDFVEASGTPVRTRSGRV